MEGSNITTEGAAFGFMAFHLDVPERMGGTSKPTKIFRWEIFDWIGYGLFALSISRSVSGSPDVKPPRLQSKRIHSHTLDKSCGWFRNPAHSCTFQVGMVESLRIIWDIYHRFQVLKKRMYHGPIGIHRGQVDGSEGPHSKNQSSKKF